MRKINKVFGLGALVVASAAVNAQVGGFVDAGFTYYPTGLKTFSVKDAAVQGTKSLGAGGATFDLPFKQNDSGTSGFKVDSARTQAFVNWKYDNGVSWKLGAFDGIYGLDANDSIDRTLTTASMAYALLPVQILGTQVSYELSEAIKLHAIVSNPADRGQHSSNPAPVELGGKIDASFAGFNTSLGYQQVKAWGDLPGGIPTQAAPNNYKGGYVASLTATTTMGDLNLGLDIAMLKPATDKDGQINEFTSSVQKAGNAKAVSLSAGMPLMADTTLNARVDYATGLIYKGTRITQNVKDSTVGITVGPTFKMTEDFKVKVDVAAYQDKYHDRSRVALLEPKTTKKIYALGVSAIHKF